MDRSNGAVKGSAARQHPEADVVVYELKLEDDGSPSKERSYIRLPSPTTPYVLRISIEAGSTASKQASLFTNFPLGEGGFGRKKFWERKLPTDFTKSISVDLPIVHAGAFEFYVEYAAPDEPFPLPTKEQPLPPVPASPRRRVRGKSCYFNVDPILSLPTRARILDQDSLQVLPATGSGKTGGTVKKEHKPLSQDGIVLLSFIAKWAGPLRHWPTHLDVARDSGYNMLHFPPLQVRGDSDSPYSIADQNDWAKDLFVEGEGGTREERDEIVGSWLARLKNEWGMLSMIDIVLNHTANNSPWLQEHPESGYNPYNSPHLTPAVELDEALLTFSRDLSKYGLPTVVKSSADVDILMAGLKENVLGPLKLWQYYVLDVAAELSRFQEEWDSRAAAGGKADGDGDAAAVVVGTKELEGKTFADLGVLLRTHFLKNRLALSARFITSIDLPSALPVIARLAERDGADRGKVVAAYRKALEVVNVPLYEIYDGDVKAIIENVGNRLTYTRLDPNGPKYGVISEKSPVMEPYFTRLRRNETTAKHDPRQLSLANNGWIWAADPLSDFASSSSRVYLRREVIVWSDCVKLRYGIGPEDSPYLWKHMGEYVRKLARMFAAFRVDNCHSTPIHVGEYFLDLARKENPNLYVCAELFTGNEDTDTYFVSRLGINSLIREAMNGYDPKEESRLLYRYGLGKPIGSMDFDCLSEPSTVLPITGGKTPVRCLVVPLEGSAPHALLMDCTHDNESISDKRTAEDTLATGSLVPFSFSAIGSNKGFDEIYPKLLNLVQEKRRYGVQGGADAEGIGRIKRVLNHLHTEMVSDGFTEGHVHQENDYILLHRVHPKTHRGYLLIVHTAFHVGSKGRGYINPIDLARTKARYIVGASLDVLSREDPADPELLKGLPSRLVDLSAPVIEEVNNSAGPVTRIIVPDDFPPGSVMLLQTWIEGLGDDLDELCVTGAAEAFSSLDLVDLNVVLYRADGEERDATDGVDGVYNVPNFGTLTYCGLEGWIVPLRHIMRYNDLGHPICAHLREGCWAMDYIRGRLEKQSEMFPSLVRPAAWFKERFDAIVSLVPSFLRPKYFALVVNTAYNAARERALDQMGDFVKNGHKFTQSLAMVAIQMNGRVKSASLWPDKEVASMAAGLPFFTAGWARVWGRDTFISLRGLFLTTGMHAAAKEHILSAASTLKHGLIPNLLDSGRTPRYNCRDGAFFFLQNVQDYVNMVPGGEAILQESVKRRFPKDDEWIPWNDPKAFSYSSTIAEVIQEILQRHAQGIHFREHNAGPNLDRDMKYEGFNIDIVVDWETGLIFGGNQWNCGTWQDKNGSSEKAGNKGVPGSPRDGAPVEITGLLKSTLRWLDELSNAGKFPHKGVQAKIHGTERLVSFKEWGNLVQESFERCYYVPLDPAEDKNYKVDANLVNRRGIYKDVYGSGKGREWSDYQLRANFPMAMCFAPELFDPVHALAALHMAHKVLRGPLGMKTLDPSDFNYRPNYVNSDDSDDFHVAKGWNYHNGPEWVFPMGFFLRAYSMFDMKAGAGKKSPSETFFHISSLLRRHRQYIATDPWAGLPELTQAEGVDCPDSCRTQAWSASTILDALEEIYRVEKKMALSPQT